MASIALPHADTSSRVMGSRPQGVLLWNVTQPTVAALLGGLVGHDLLRRASCLKPGMPILQHRSMP